MQGRTAPVGGIPDRRSREDMLTPVYPCIVRLYGYTPEARKVWEDDLLTLTCRGAFRFSGRLAGCLFSVCGDIVLGSVSMPCTISPLLL